ncbi:MAG: ATPase, T2SS/T4P/T4SS family [Gemmatimonadaceae bacterium]
MAVLAGGESLDSATDVRDLANQPPVIRYVNMLLREAFDASASDIHLEATPSGVLARFRIDGTLTVAPAPPAQLHHGIVSRIKLLAELDIAERRRPQDGRIRCFRQLTCDQTLTHSRATLAIHARVGGTAGLKRRWGAPEQSLRSSAMRRESEHSRWCLTECISS